MNLNFFAFILFIACFGFLVYLFVSYKEKELKTLKYKLKHKEETIWIVFTQSNGSIRELINKRDLELTQKLKK